MAEFANVLFLRHGRTDWNDQGRLQGRTDIPLNADGVSGARAAASRLLGGGVRHVFASPLSRARLTADIIAEALNVSVTIDARLIERNFGTLEGRFFTDIAAQEGLNEGFAADRVLPGGAETWDSVKARMLEAYLDASTSTGPVLIVSHLASMSILAEALNGAAPPPGNCVPFALPQIQAQRKTCVSQSSV